MSRKIIFYGGDILTMDEAADVEAVVVENGRIVAVGSRQELTCSADYDERIDLQGATLMPAFIDAHSHFTQVANSFLQVSLDGAVSYEDIDRRIRSYVQENKINSGEWIVARDYDQNIMPDGKYLTLSQLDSMAPDNPLVVHHKSGHMGLFNSAAMEFLGITDASVSPAGGQIGRENGKLTGYMEENAFFEYLKKIPMPGMDKLAEAFVKAQNKYAANGITTVQEGMLVNEMLPLYKMLLDKNILKLDLVAYSGTDSIDAVKMQLSKHMEDYCNHLRIGGLKIFLDGSPQGRTAWMREPYQGGDYRGYGTMTDEEVCDAFALAAKLRMQLIAHCNGDAASGQFIRCLECMEKKYPELAELRHVIIHGQLIGRDQLKDVSCLGAVISFFAAHVYHWGDAHIRNFGIERASAISPAASALQNGVLFTFHQDAPVIQPDMLETIWCAVNRITREGVLLGGEERISVMDALRAVTINAAYQYGEEDSKGSITPGKVADLVVLDKNPMKIPKEELKQIKILRTYKCGECVSVR